MIIITISVQWSMEWRRGLGVDLRILFRYLTPIGSKGGSTVAVASLGPIIDRVMIECKLDWIASMDPKRICPFQADFI